MMSANIPAIGSQETRLGTPSRTIVLHGFTCTNVDLISVTGASETW